jgi:hypothetical protein
MHSRCRKLLLIEFIIDRRRSLETSDQSSLSQQVCTAKLHGTGYTKLYLTPSS